MNNPLPDTALSSLPGTGRLGMISGYFVAVGSAAALGIPMITATILGLHHDLRTVSPKELALLLGAISLTFGCFRTSRLLDRRKREGIASAGIMLIAPIVGYSTHMSPGPIILAASVIGLTLLASVWRCLAD